MSREVTGPRSRPTDPRSTLWRDRERQLRSGAVRGEPPDAELSRRAFLQLLGAATLAGSGCFDAPHQPILP
jgi:hypothetical protein